ncbi:MAG: DNA polymerase I [Candidatus Brocadiia bacterium]
MPEKLLVIDAYAHIYQFFYAIKGLTGPDGEPVNALYGFARMIEKIRDEYEPDYLAVAFDGPGELERRGIYEDYKADRPPMPDALQRQIPLIEQLLDAQSIPRLTSPGHEADDVLAALAQRAEEQGVETVIVTTDKDAEQLIDEHTSVLHVHKDREVLMDPETLKDRKGITPEQVVDMMALAGDTTDNVPGVPGVGPKTAQALIRQFGSIESLYENLEKVSGPKTRQRLAEHRDDVELARKLVRLRRDIPLEVDWDACRTEDGKSPELDRFYRAVGFHSLRQNDPAPVSAQTTLFGQQQPARTHDLLDKDYRTVTSLDELHELARELGGLERLSFDLETTSLHPRDARIVGLAFSWQPHQGVYVATDGPPGSETCPLDEALRMLKPILEAERPLKVGQNLKYDIGVLRNYGIEPAGIHCDSMVASYLLTPASRSHGLDALARRYLNYRTMPIEELIGAGSDQTTMDKVPVGKVGPYACEDADVALQLCELLGERLEQAELGALLRHLELPLIPVLAQMEWTGIKVDTDALKALSEEFAGQTAQLEQKIHREAGETFNVNSPQQLSTILFEKMGLPPPRNARRTTGYSTASDVLTDLKPEHPIADYVLQYRELAKLKSTYADALLQMVHPETGRIHASFNQTVTATGRLSSSDPNLQNIPVRTPLGRRIRTAFVPGEADMSLLGADYSQVELRILAHCSGDETLKGAFREDRDIHRFVAAQVNDVAEHEVTDLMRQRAKAVNFGIIYGLSPYGLSKQIGIPVEEAEQFIAGYFERYPRVKSFIGDTVERARRQGFVTTLAGRKRRIEGIRSSGATRSAAERIAVNTVIQGSAADLIKRAMIRIHPELPQVSARANMLLQIHDELVFEAPDEELDAVRRLVTQCMTDALELDVPLKVDTATGKNWAETK